ncbi:hypothetical protein [Microbulbifer sp. GL-2]|uniref:hypothetical protein n=1 Tax=Microbulbifer sp. GL-2 TaxID=2591606 RepID=UPI001164A476|nr:hypothetical protein [Microbulbifer sp. GL-2]BBM03774.1 hypothetical protein GL2_38480 [Microbulbifer sp. GL-2]
MASKLNLTDTVIGDSLSLPLVFKDESGEPIDISGRTFWFTLKLNPQVPDDQADAQAVVIAPVDANSQNGEVFIGYTAEQTENLNATSYNYDVQMATPIPGGEQEVKTIVYGRIRFVQQITRSRLN